jgi:hypothetical protein
MPAPDAPGLSGLDEDRAHSMEHEGGASAALIERAESSVVPWQVPRAVLACAIGLLAGVGLMVLLRSR